MSGSIEEKIERELEDKPELAAAVRKEVESYRRLRTYAMDLEDYQVLETDKYDILITKGEVRSWGSSGGIGWDVVVEVYASDKETKEVTRKRVLDLTSRDRYDARKDDHTLQTSRGVVYDVIGPSTIEVGVLGADDKKIPYTTRTVQLE